MKKNFLKEIQFSADCRSEMSVVMLRFTNMHCSRDISEKIHKKKYFCLLIVSVRSLDHREQDTERGNCYYSIFTDKKSNNKPEVMAKPLQCYPSEINSHASSTELFFFPWTPQSSTCPCTVTVCWHNLHKEAPTAFAFSAEQIILKATSHVSGLSLSWLKWNGY